MSMIRLESDDKSPPLARSDHECFGCGDDNASGLHLRFKAARDGVAARFTPSRKHQGYDSLVHGGIISTLLDEAMAWAAANAGIWAVTGELTVRFRRPLRVGEETEVRGWVTANHGRLVLTAAEVHELASQTIVASASGKLLRVGREKEAAWRARYLQPAEVAGS
jgi:uncharacterized protein (TIGR00369 family)